MPPTNDSIRLQIFNAALAEAESSQLRTLQDTSAEAAACRAVFPTIFASELQRYEWPFALNRAELTKDATEPLGVSWAASYDLPASFVRMIALDTLGVVSWKIEGTKLLVNPALDKVVAVYTGDVELTATSAAFRRLVELRIAVRLAYRLKKDRMLAGTIDSRMGDAVQAALSEQVQWSRSDTPLAYETPTRLSENYADQGDPRRAY